MSVVAGVLRGSVTIAAAIRLLTAAALVVLPDTSVSQGTGRINIYRYILDIDVPEPAARGPGPGTRPGFGFARCSALHGTVALTGRHSCAGAP